MSEEKALWAGIFQEYLFWIVGLLFAALSGAFYLGYSIQTLDSRVTASELSIRDTNEDRKAKSAEVFSQLKEMNRNIGVLQGEVSIVKGQNELILRRMR